jgi:hypothetical protein
MTREDALKKAEKLIALVNGAATPEEAAAASLALQKLLAKYNLDMREVENGSAEDQREEVTEEEAETTSAMHLWEVRIACTVRDNFRCGLYTQSLYGRKQRIVFYGEGEDAKNAARLYVALKSAAKNCWNDYRPKAKACMEAHGFSWSAARHRGEYLEGFAQGIKDAFRKQAEEDAGVAIMLVKPESVKRYEREELHLTRSHASYAYHGRGSAYKSGQRDGYSVGRGNAVRA